MLYYYFASIEVKFCGTPFIVVRGVVVVMDVQLCDTGLLLVSTVRHPFQRIVSAYRDKFNKADDLQQTEEDNDGADTEQK